MKNVIGVLTLFLFVSSAYASEDYMVRTKIYDGENLIASPAMKVAPGEEAGAAISGIYDLKLSVKPGSKNNVNVNTKLVIGLDQLSPSMLVELDKESTASVNGKSITVLVSKTGS